MKIVLGNFKLWRMKKFLIFTICIWSSILILFHIKSDRVSAIFILIGLILYAVIIDLPWVKSCTNEIYVEDRDTEICIMEKKKIYTINKMEMKEVLLKEIKYGGKWLDTIGYRLIIIADKKYIFDSVLMNENCNFKEGDFNQFVQLFKDIKQ